MGSSLLKEFLPLRLSAQPVLSISPWCRCSKARSDKHLGQYLRTATLNRQFQDGQTRRKGFDRCWRRILQTVTYWHGGTTWSRLWRASVETCICILHRQPGSLLPPPSIQATALFDLVRHRIEKFKSGRMAVRGIGASTVVLPVFIRADIYRA